MVKLVDVSWVEARLEDPDVFLLDPRGRMKYLAGHLKGAANLPATRLLDSSGTLLTPGELANLVGDAGLSDSVTPVLYDSHDGQRGAMMAWVLEYLGRSDVHLMDSFFEGWAASGKETFYRPVRSCTALFTPKVNDQVRASFDDVRSGGPVKLLDVRSSEEYSGQSDIDEKPGHIPGSVNLAWKDLIGYDHAYLRPFQDMVSNLKQLGIEEGDEVITYCRMGMRATVGYLALQQLGYQVKVYDGSYLEWSKSDQPVEI